MSKELEALERGIIEFEKNLEDDPNNDWLKRTIAGMKKCYQRLEVIDNSNPSEALECLLRFNNFFTDRARREPNNPFNDKWLENIETIKQALIQANQHLEARRNGKTLEQMYQLVQYSRTPMKPSIWIARIDGKLEQRVVIEKEYYDKLQIKAQEQEKVLEIIKEKGLSLAERDMIKHSENYEQYQIKISWWNYKPFAIPKSKEEFDLLKRYFK